MLKTDAVGTDPHVQVRLCGDCYSSNGNVQLVIALTSAFDAICVYIIDVRLESCHARLTGQMAISVGWPQAKANSIDTATNKK